ncbi:hypothetical protein [Neptunicella sp. SCSIO 80796]|uniref:hypothetical protein n=1 Tax=Neptunicella plasticusilytica TaxID=3117012 RepID=UPI003A4E1309
MNNKKSILLLALVFVVPVILAKLALELDWFNKGATNKGQLLDPVLDMSPLYPADSAPTIWRVVYIMPAQCEQRCQNALYSINQVWLALGRENERVSPVIITTASSDQSAIQQLESMPNLTLFSTNQQSIDRVFKDTATDGIFVVDTLQNIILRYDLQQEQQQAVMHSREILADVKKLLKLSRIG